MGDFGKDLGKDVAIGVVIDSGPLIKALINGPKKVIDAIDQRLAYEAPRLEAMMKTNAPWKDQTGNARNGLAAHAYHNGNEQGIVLYHQVPYGVWLELAHEGRFAVVIPTMESEGPRIMEACQGLLGKI